LAGLAQLAQTRLERGHTTGDRLNITLR